MESCIDDYIRNPSISNLECNKACKIDKQMDAKIVNVKNVYLVNRLLHVDMRY